MMGEKFNMRYSKTEEHFTTSYNDAQELADQLFAPYGTKNSRGERNSSAVKVRVRLSLSRDGREKGYRVVVYRSQEEVKMVVEEPLKNVAQKKRKPRHRNDRKGKHKGNGSASD